MYFAATTALSNGKQGEKYIAEQSAWGYGPYDYVAIGAHYIGFHEEALKYGLAALDVAKKQMQPEDVIKRLEKNIEEYKLKIQQKTTRE
jgi:hypothetical protein